MCAGVPSGQEEYEVGGFADLSTGELIVDERYRSKCSAYGPFLIQNRMLFSSHSLSTPQIPWTTSKSKSVYPKTHTISRRKLTRVLLLPVGRRSPQHLRPDHPHPPRGLQSRLTPLSRLTRLRLSRPSRTRRQRYWGTCLQGMFRVEDRGCG